MFAAELLEEKGEASVWSGLEALFRPFKTGVALWGRLSTLKGYWRKVDVGQGAYDEGS